MWLTRVAVVVVVSSLGIATASATSDQECFDKLHGFDPVDKVIWKRTDCSCTTALQRLDLDRTKVGFRSVAAKTKVTSDAECVIAPKAKRDRASYKRAAPMIAMPADELRIDLDKKYRAEFDQGTPIPLELAGEHITKNAFSAKLASPPKIEGAFLLPGTKRGIAEVRYGEFAGCCPYQGRQAFVLFKYRARVKKRGSAELRVGPSYLALSRANRHSKGRVQISMPSSCGHHARKGKSAPQLPFDVPCVKGRKLTVSRSGDHIAVHHDTTEIGRIHLHADDKLRIVGEEIISADWNGEAYTHERIVCTYGGRCTHVSDNHLGYAITSAATPVCSGGLCLLVPKRRRVRTTLAYRKDSSEIRTVKLPELDKNEVIVGIERRTSSPYGYEAMVRDDDGNERRASLAE